MATTGVRRLYVEKRQGYFDIPAQQLAADLIETFRLTSLKAVRIFIRYDIEGLTDAEYKAVRDVVFVEPPVDAYHEESLPSFPDARMFAIEPLPGQFDQRADSAAQCVQLVTAKERPTIRTAQIILILGRISEEEYSKIKDYCINTVESREAKLSKVTTLKEPLKEPADVAVVNDFINMDEVGLQRLMNDMGLAMSFEDLESVQRYFAIRERRNPTVTEIRVIDTYWSDHCRHTTFTTVLDSIEIESGKYAAMLTRVKDLYFADRAALYAGENRDTTLMDIAVIGMKALRKAGKLDDLDVSDEINACSIVVPAVINGKEEKWLVMFKNETHNHPTEIEPFGGAATCLGGAIRDPLSGRSYVYQAMRVTGAADPRRPIRETLPGKLPQKKITLGAAAGYSSYGNQIGLATGQVKEIYHEGYMAKRMEIGAVIASAPAENVVREAPAEGDVVVLLGGRTGRDGIGGATGSSKVHTTASLTEAGAEVQKGNPPTERKIQRLFRNPTVSRMIKRCNDFGAGGVAVAIGELAPSLNINLDAVKKKYEGLDGTEIAISESQERMAVVLARRDVSRFLEYAEQENLEATEVAEITNNGKLIMRWRGKVIVSLARAFLDTNGVRQHVRVKMQMPDLKNPYFQACPTELESARKKRDLTAAWVANMSRLNVCSQKGLVERFDSTIGAGTVLMPFGGKQQLTEEQGMVAKLPILSGETDTATAMSYGYDPYLSEWSPFHGAVYAVVEAAAKIAALGGDTSKIRLTFQEYFERLGKDPLKWGKPTAALLGALWAQHQLEIPAIGGKDSMSGTFENISVPPTLVAFAVDVVQASRTVSAAFKFPGNKVYILKVPRDSNDLPHFETMKKTFARVYKLAQDKKLFAAMSVGIGGIAAAVTKMALGNKMGFRFENALPFDDLFRPEYGSIIIEMSENANPDDSLAGLKWSRLGATTTSESVVCGDMVQTIAELTNAYTKPLEKIFQTKAKLHERGMNVPIIPYTEGRTSAKSSYRTGGAKPRVFIPVFPGTNCEVDSARAFEAVGGQVETLVIRNLTPKAVEESVEAIVKGIERANIVMLPGGFSGGDEPDGSGKFIAATFRNPRIADAVMRFLRQRDGLMLGICNGFQALIKLGLLPYGEICSLTTGTPTLTHNIIGRHVSCMVETRIMSNRSPWLSNVSVGDIHSIAVSHGEGRFVADRELVAKMRQLGQIATQYVDDRGDPTMYMPFNPNGSYEAIEGITSPDGHIFGKMGHSERVGEFIGKNVPGNKDQKIFEAGIQYFR
ncbi:phosphoribosylformylglycinamidine synthase subunit PurQ [Selenomonas sp. TAMA-11512]|uniref:phosphoribosylformylglycinamidine synthase n=1 Tax=Selenomonas sp. TAMA-11512 TaxID=3095337 RepID=UPI0030896707|nr:phosphoribosylformylglycinamidine synthase subunit PurQ [Selenomonas sp. TAMA-11512]